MKRRALIVGVSGIAGSALAEKLLKEDWIVYGLSRGNTPIPTGCVSLITDLLSEQSVNDVLKAIEVDNVFFSVWSRQENEQANIRVNRAIVKHVLDALGHKLKGKHVALVTGLKHYLGPFESYAQDNVRQTPFREEQGRQPIDNFYYAQEDELFEQAQKLQFTWSVHRPHTIIGYAVGNAMNMGQTLAVYASLCKQTGEPFIFPGSAAQWNGITDMTDAGILANQLYWAATNPEGQNQDFNIVNGDVFRWKWMWNEIAKYFDIPVADFDGELRPLESRMQNSSKTWIEIAKQHNLKESDITKLASWWHTDADLGRPMEVFTSMCKSRQAGFLDYLSTRDSFYALFDQLKSEHLIP